MSQEQHPTRKTSKKKTAETVASKLASLEAEARWQDKAACKGMDPILFFGPDHAETVKEKRDREDEAKAVCARCSVAVECLEYSLGAKEAYGIWGGMTEVERKALLRKRAS